jgi:5-methylcytosine-specific restriction endonuclease McrA
MRRPNGAGTISQRANGLWMGQVSVRTAPGQRQRVTVYGRSVSEVEQKMDTARQANAIEVKERHTPTLRRQRVDAARSLGSHTAREWGDLQRASDHRCYYCSAFCLRRPTKDHVVPVSRGGSDRIENIVLACRYCNSAKGTMTQDEFLSLASRAERHAAYQEGALNRGLLAGDSIPRGRD